MTECPNVETGRIADAALMLTVGAFVGVVASFIAWYGGWVPIRKGIISDLSSSFGPVVIEVLDRARFALCDEVAGCRYTERLPAVPIFHVLLSGMVGRDLFAHLIAKNILIYGISSWALGMLLRATGASLMRRLTVVLILFLNPIAFRSFSGLGGEENYYAFPLLVCFLLLWTREEPSWLDAAVLGGLLFLLAMTKSTLVPWALATAIYAAICWRRTARSLVPAACVVIALAGWSLWSHAATGHWTHAANISSYDGVNFFKGNNDYVSRVYPEVHLDALENAGLVPIFPGAGEWEASARYFNAAKDWLFDTPLRVPAFLAYKTYIVFLDLRWPGKIYVHGTISPEELLRLPSEGYVWSVKTVAQSALLVVYKLLFLYSVALALNRVVGGAGRARAASYLVLGGLLAAPFVAGFAYVNHLAVLYDVAFLFLAIDGGRWSRAADRPYASSAT